MLEFGEVKDFVSMELLGENCSPRRARDIAGDEIPDILSSAFMDIDPSNL